MKTKFRLLLAKKGLRLAADIAPETVGRLLAERFCTPVRKVRPVGERDILRMAERRSRVNGCAVYEWGRGPTVLLVHGWEGHAGQLGNFVAPLVDAGFRVVAWELPAHGDSGGYRANLPACARELVHFARAYGPIYGVVSHSFGGLITRLAVAWGLKIKCLVQIASPFSMQKIFDDFSASTGLPNRTAAAFQRQIEATANVTAAEIDSLITKLPADFPKPLAIHCRDDQKVKIEESEALCAHDRRWSFVPLRGLGHRRILRDATVVNVACQFVAESFAAERAFETNSSLSANYFYELARDSAML